MSWIIQACAFGYQFFVVFVLPVLEQQVCGYLLFFVLHYLSLKNRYNFVANCFVFFHPF